MITGHPKWIHDVEVDINKSSKVVTTTISKMTIWGGLQFGCFLTGAAWVLSYSCIGWLAMKLGQTQRTGMWVSIVLVWVAIIGIVIWLSIRRRRGPLLVILENRNDAPELVRQSSHVLEWRDITAIRLEKSKRGYFEDRSEYTPEYSILADTRITEKPVVIQRFSSKFEESSRIQRLLKNYREIETLHEMTAEGSVM